MGTPRTRHARWLLAPCLAGALAMAGCNNGPQGLFSGAALGSLAGFGLGSLSGNAGEGAAAGAIIGAATGAVIGDQNARSGHTYHASHSHGSHSQGSGKVYVEEHHYHSHPHFHSNHSCHSSCSSFRVNTYRGWGHGWRYGYGHRPYRYHRPYRGRVFIGIGGGCH